jgi:hypothetical protein
MRILFGFLLFASLAACGADGEPTAPGFSVSGEAKVGVVYAK